MWVSLGFQKALTKSNIAGGFHGIGIWPFNSHAVDSFLGPSRKFVASSISATENANQETTLEQNIDDSEQNHEGEDHLLIEEMEDGRLAARDEAPEHYFVPTGLSISMTKSPSTPARTSWFGIIKKKATTSAVVLPTTFAAVATTTTCDAV